MPEIPNVLPGGETESDWANLIRDRTVQRYPTEAARDASNPTPQRGDVVFIQDSGLLQVYGSSAVGDTPGWENITFGGTAAARLDLLRNSADSRFRWAIAADGGLLLQSLTADGGSVNPTILSVSKEGDVRSNGRNYVLGNAVDGSITTTPQNLVQQAAPGNGVGQFLVMCSGYLEVAIPAGFAFWQFELRRGTDNAQYAATQISTDAGSFRGPIAMSTIMSLPTGGNANLSLTSRNVTGGTQLFKRCRIAMWRIA